MDELMRTPEGLKEVLSYKEGEEECKLNIFILFH
jgi:hypothetical protein